MKYKYLKEALSLVKKNNHRLIILDEGEPYVILSFKDYQDLIEEREISSLTEKELLDKINSDIALWKSIQEEKIKEISLVDNLRDVKSEGEEEEERYYFEKLD